MTSDQTYWNVLRLLKERRGSFLSGAALASRLGLSRTGIWKHIQSLRARGYEIASHPKDGYSLIDSPDAAIPEEILPELKTDWLARSYHYLPTVGSTNDFALKLAIDGAPHGAVVVAEEQTTGRGRLRRPWLSSPNLGIYMSLLLRSPLPVREASQATAVAALAFSRTARELYGIPAAIKWPNDILVRNRKLVGILTEMQSDQDLARFLVIGIGINVNHSAEEFSGPMRYPATSIAMELGRTVKRQELLLAFFERFEADYARFLSGGFASLAADIERHSAILGKIVTVHCGSEEYRGKALGFTPEGALVLLTEEARRQEIWVGDVTRVEGFDEG